jgi:hypothetical protein
MNTADSDEDNTKNEEHCQKEDTLYRELIKFISIINMK